MDTEVIYCTSCGAANAGGAKFCFKCGKLLQTAVPAAPTRPQSDFITLACPNCGGNLEITPDMERFACKFCGNEHLVRRSGGVVSLAPVVEGLKRVESKFDQVLTGSDRLAAEQTIQRLKAEIYELTRQMVEKGLFIKKNSVTTGSIVGLVMCIGVGIFGYIGGMSFIETASRYEKWVGWLVVVIAVSTFITGLVWSSVMVSKNKRQQVQQAKAEYTQLSAELYKRQQQLEQLHQYTIER